VRATAFGIAGSAFAGSHRIDAMSFTIGVTAAT
jgi:hypothetical protein